MRLHDRLRVDAVAVAFPAAVLITVFLVAPLLTFLAYSFLTPGFFSVSRPATLSNYQEVLGSEVTRKLAWNSFLIGALTATITVALGLPVAYWLRYVARRARVAVLFLIILSMLAGYLVRIYAWRTILGDNGVLNRGLQQLGVIDEPLGFLIFSRFAVVIALVQIFLPFVVLVIYAGFGSLPASLLESAEDLGANALKRWRRVVMPLIAAPAASAFLFVFVLAASDYVTPQFIGGRGGAMLGVEVQVNLTVLGNWSYGGATSFLMVLSFLAVYGLTLLALRFLHLHRVSASN